MAEWLIVVSLSLVAFAAILGGLVVGFWIARVKVQSAVGQIAAEHKMPSSSGNTASQASRTLADELLAEKLRLYLRVLQENGKVFETLVAVDVAGGGRRKRRPDG